MLIKEYCGTRIVVRDDRHGSRLSKFLLFFEEAKKDFPWITPENVEFKHYVGDTFGMEFNITSDVEIPTSYLRIDQLKGTL